MYHTAGNFHWTNILPNPATLEIFKFCAKGRHRFHVIQGKKFEFLSAMRAGGKKEKLFFRRNFPANKQYSKEEGFYSNIICARSNKTLCLLSSDP